MDILDLQVIVVIQDIVVIQVTADIRAIVVLVDIQVILVLVVILDYQDSVVSVVTREKAVILDLVVILVIQDLRVPLERRLFGKVHGLTYLHTLLMMLLNIMVQLIFVFRLNPFPLLGIIFQRA